MGGFTNAISNALAARGNALAQGELQRGQVWGNLAANLGQIPFQAMQAGQRRRLAEVETEQRGLQNQAMQQELNFQKEMSAIMTDQSLSSEQRDLRGLDTLKKYGKLAQFEEIQARRTQTAVQKYNVLKGQPGTQVPQGQIALPEPTRSTSVYGTGALAPGGGPVVQPEGMQNAFAPPTPVEAQMVHPEIPGLGAPQTDTQQHQAKVLKIKSLGLDPETEKLAIEALVVPAGILAAQMRGTTAPQVGLGVSDYVSPDGKNQVSGQATRSGHVLITVGSVVDTESGRTYQPGELAPANVMANWTKVYHQPLQAFPNAQGSIDVLNKQELARQMSRGGAISGNVPDIQPAETKTPLVNETGAVSGEWGSRTGLSGMKGGGAPQELLKSPRSKTEMDARTYMDTALSQLDQIKEIAGRRPDLIGPYDSFKENVLKRGFGQQEDPDANNLYGALDRFKEDLIRAKEGAVIPPEMYNRLSALVAGKAWSNEKQFATDMENAANVLRIAREKRGMSTGGAAPSAPAGVGPYKDPGKEARYQEFLLRNKGK